MTDQESKNLDTSATESTSGGDWGVLHLNRFCPEEQEFCIHELLLDGLEETFDYLEKTCKPKNEWRNKVLYGEFRAKHNCIICFTEIEVADNAIGVYRRDEKKKKAFVMHDTCLSMISGSPDEILDAMKNVLMDKKKKDDLEKHSIFESPSVCSECFRVKREDKRKKQFKTDMDKRILSCSDLFCPTSFHFACALKSQKCIIDFFDRVLCCKEHEELLSRPNACEVRGKQLSQSPSTWDNCIECSQKVARWPIRGKVFYMSCCESFCHWNCAFTRMNRRMYQCRCGSKNKYFETLQRQGLCLLNYRDDMVENGCRIRRASESEASDSAEDDSESENEEAEDEEDDQEMESEQNDDDDEVIVIDDDDEVEVIDISDDAEDGKENGDKGVEDNERKVKRARVE